MAKNVVIIEGEVFDEPSLRNTRSGVDVSNFLLQVVEEQNPPFEIHITAFGKVAVECATKFPRGSRVRITGRLGKSQNTKEKEILVNDVVAVA
jgi:single-stranded DNA-binding protein